MDIRNLNSEILTCFALKEEARPFRSALPFPHRAHVLITGMGRRNVESALRHFLDDHAPGLVLSCGFAGALDPALAIGTVLFETADPALRPELERAGACPAKLHCADRIATSALEKRQLRQTTGADAVEMESGVVQSLCRDRGIVCATVRAISDAADEDLPLDFNALTTRDLGLHYGKMALALARSPARIGGLLKLQRQSKIAAAALASVLCRIVSA